MTYIPLETNDSVLISVITQISYENEKILIKDTDGSQNNCYLFDKNGNFCCKIGRRGQGPDDYLFMNNVFIHDNLIFLNVMNKILIYNFNGYLVEKINFRLYDSISENRWYDAINYILPLKKDTFIMDIVLDYGYYPKAVLFETYQSNVKMINEYPNYVRLDKHPGVSHCEIGIMYRYKEDVRIYKVINDTIFTVGQNMEMKDAFIFELGKYRPTRSYMERKEDYRFIMNYIFPWDFLESLNHLFIRFSFGNHSPEPFGNSADEHSVYGVFDKLTGQLTLMNQPIKGKLGFKNDIDGGPVIWPHYITSNNELVTYLSAEEFMDYFDKIEKPTPQMTEIAKKISWDDNQIIIIAKLK